MGRRRAGVQRVQVAVGPWRRRAACRSRGSCARHPSDGRLERQSRTFRLQAAGTLAGPDARRFELSTMSYSAAVGLLASIKLLAGIGLRSIHEHAGRLAADLVEQTAPLGWTPYRGTG